MEQVALVGAGLIGQAIVGLRGEGFGASNALIIMTSEGILPLLQVGWLWRKNNQKNPQGQI